MEKIKVDQLRADVLPWAILFLIIQLEVLVLGLLQCQVEYRIEGSGDNSLAIHGIHLTILTFIKKDVVVISLATLRVVLGRKRITEFRLSEGLYSLIIGLFLFFQLLGLLLLGLGVHLSSLITIWIAWSNIHGGSDGLCLL